MSGKSVYLPRPVIENDLIRIQDEEHRHLAVARARSGEAVEVFDGIGNVWDSVVARVERRETILRVSTHRFVERDPYELILGLSLVQASAFELAIEKAVETGVHRIVPMVASRSNIRDVRRADRWQRIIVEASKQAKRYHLPMLEPTVSFDEILSFTAAARLMFAERNGGPLKPAVTASPVLYLIGPEGGWTEDEMESARRQGFSLVGLGPTILRTETAAIVATVLLRYELLNR